MGAPKEVHKIAKTVEEGFREFHNRLTPTLTESEAAKRHRASIRDCLVSNFGMTNFFRTGSFGNATSIRGYSDVDYFAVIPTGNLNQNSSTTLRKMRNVLDARFPNTGVSVRTPAVRVPFGRDASESTEVVPADFIKTSSKGYNIYEIPDGNGGWRNSSPKAHNSWVTDINGKLSRKVKPLIRFIKAWKYYRNVPISSFYLELRVTKLSCESFFVYSIDLKNIFENLWNGQLAAIRDPMGISGYVQPCFTSTQKVDALSKLQTALVRAEKAREAESSKKIYDAFYWWNLVFDGHFPSYY